MYIKKEHDNYETINDVLNSEFNISARLRTKLINIQKIFLNDEICDTRSRININDKISINFDYEEENTNIVPTKMELDIIYEDEWLIAINKPYGIPVHPSLLHYQDSLSNGLKYYLDSIGLKKKIRPVNRLDRNTSGIVIFAKCEYVQECLIKQMQDNVFKKEYIALVEGHLAQKNGTIDLPIARKQNSIIERCIDENGQKSTTHYEVLKEFSDYSLVKCTLETGRTHQIRVHFSAISHPLLGDDLYGGKTSHISRQALHCSHLSFIHPVSKNRVNLESNFPSDITSLI